jgi:ribonuclease HI
MSGFKEAITLGNYLGVPALGRTPRKKDFHYLVEKVKQHLAGWKAQQLSLAGRITLAQSVIQAIPIYPMMSTPIPKRCLHEIEKLQRGFIWGDNSEGRKVHLIGWDTLTLPKRLGGIGLRKLHIMNDACIMKLGWSLLQGKESLWAQVLLGKYGRGVALNEALVSGPTDSALWKAIVRLWPYLKQNRTWAIGDGQTINFWQDKWWDSQHSLSDIVERIPEDIINWKLKDVVSDIGTWNVNKFNAFVPKIFMSKIQAILPPQIDQGSDMHIWPGESGGNYMVADGYNRLAGISDHEEDHKWRKVWKLASTQRIRVFVWHILHNRLLTNDRLASWHLKEPYCDYCGQMEESLLHVLRDCPLASLVWRHLVEVNHWSTFFLYTREQWFELNLRTHIGRNKEVKWDAIWATTCYYLWQWRNQRVHDTRIQDPYKPWEIIMNSVTYYMSSMDSHRSLHNNLSMVNKDVRWYPPKHGWVCLNTDGASKSQTTNAGCGGLLRDEDGHWIRGFSKSLGSTTAYVAELWGLLEGLSMARSMGFNKLEVQMDSEIIVNIINKHGQGSVSGWSIIKKIRSLLSLDWSVKICHIYREANRCADMLANMGCVHNHGTLSYHQPPTDLMQVLDDDIRGVSFPRLVAL